jgi:hypothetical protein
MLTTNSLKKGITDGNASLRKKCTITYVMLVYSYRPYSAHFSVTRHSVVCKNRNKSQLYIDDVHHARAISDAV